MGEKKRCGGERERLFIEHGAVSKKQRMDSVKYTELRPEKSCV